MGDLGTMTSHLRRSFLGQRVWLQLRDGSSHDRQIDASVFADIDDLARRQTEFWTRNKLDEAVILDNFALLNETVLSIYILKIDGRRVEIANKPSIDIPAIERSRYKRFTRAFAERIYFYKIFLEWVIAESGLDLVMTIAIDVNDIVVDGQIAPLFSFQKKAESPNILLPDVDFFWWNWYRRQQDLLAYDDKEIVAGFVGSSTGGMNGVDGVREGHNPRLRAAAHFVGSRNVDFRIAKAVQVDGADAKSLIESQAYYSRPISWRAQFRNRFLISIDGNGAACSRLAIGLKSQAAVIKYQSPYSLFYFPKMVSGRDYIEVSCEADVERVVEAERTKPGTYRAVADAGRCFFTRYLERDRVMAYTAALLRRYADLPAAM